MATLALTEGLWQELQYALDEPRETAGFILAGVASDPGELTLLGRSVQWIADDGYQVREPDRLEIPSASFVPALKSVADDGSVAIFVHTHPDPEAAPLPSRRDHGVDEALRLTAQIRTGRDLYGSLIIATDDRFSGRVFRYGSPEAIDRLRIVGDHLRLLSSPRDGELNHRFDRQARAFGIAGQEMLSRLHIGVVGVGGTGSAVFELLTRLGVGRFTVIDDDVLSETSLTRIHESSASDIGRAKVDVARAAAERIAGGTEVIAAQGRITALDQARLLRHCDLVFGCTDDNGGRAVLSRLAYWYLVPVIDCAFLVDTEGVAVRGLFGRITTFFPGNACLFCHGRIDQQELSAEALPDAERERLAGEGYVPGLGEPDPSVGAYTTLVASIAVTEMLDRFFRFSGEQQPPSELLVRLHDREINRLARQPRPTHYCADVSNWGRGDEEPMMGQLWTGSAAG